jgi:peptide alpha-N-acetyltransferase
MVAKKGMPIFSSKEDGNFREALKLYDAKQYKKALKLVDANLKKNGNHAESLALKGCISFHVGHKEDAEPYILKAISKAPSNYLVNHLAGTYYRSVENYIEAAKWLKEANDNGSPNKPILRDLSIMQTHIRDYKNLQESRQLYLEHQPGYRANWTALAVAHHLTKDYANAVTTLAKIEHIIKDHLTEADRYEQSECVLYKIQLIAEAGDFAKALKTLEEDEFEITDKLSVLEYKARYLLLLGQKKEASLIYRKLLQRNPDNVEYYKMLELALGTADQPQDIRLKLYEKLANFYPRSDPPKYLPLTFLSSTNPNFEIKAKEYVLTQLKRGVPSTFVNIKLLIKNKKKQKIIEQFVLNFYNNEVPNIENPTIKLWTQYFLAQNYLYLNNLSEANKFIDEALNHSPTLVELYIMKARIVKHEGDLQKACEIMDKGRQLDLQDRFVNSKATKYFFRANKVDEGIDCISLFTKLDEKAVNGCKDLHTMQANWVLLESAEAYTRLYHEAQQKLDDFKKQNPSSGDSEEDDKLKETETELAETVEIYKGLALKRFHAIVNIFDIFYNDQYDFHSYCMRRGTPRDYIDTIKWEDKLHSTPIYVRAIKGLAQVYFELLEEKNSAIVEDIDEESSTKHKKNHKKNKKSKAQVNKRRAELISKVESVASDPDPLGAKLLQDIRDSDILEKLYVLFKPLNEEGKDLITTWEQLYKIYLLQGKYVLALQALKNLNNIVDPNGRKLRTIGEKVVELATTSSQDTNAPPAIAKVVSKGLSSAFPDFSDDESAFLNIYNH